jgi:NifU-like protein
MVRFKKSEIKSETFYLIGLNLKILRVFTSLRLCVKNKPMGFYPLKINEKFNAPENAGKAAGANAVGTNATFACGAVLRFTLRIEKHTKQILDAKFKTDGCGYLIASAEIITQKITGKHLTELHEFNKRLMQSEIENETEEFPISRKHCLELALDTLQIAFADFRAAQIEEWTGEKAIICTCFGVSEETIENLVEKESLRTVEDVTTACSAGGGCGSCQPLIQEIIDTMSFVA